MERRGNQHGQVTSNTCADLPSTPNAIANLLLLLWGGPRKLPSTPSRSLSLSLSPACCPMTMTLLAGEDSASAVSAVADTVRVDTDGDVNQTVETLSDVAKGVVEANGAGEVVTKGVLEANEVVDVGGRKVSVPLGDADANVGEFCAGNCSLPSSSSSSSSLSSPSSSMSSISNSSSSLGPSRRSSYDRLFRALEQGIELAM